MENTLGVDGPALVDRAKRILVDPRGEWPVIESEVTTTEKLYRGYIAPLAAIPAIAGFIGMSIIGISLPFVGRYRAGIVGGIVQALLTWVLAMVGVYIAALVINKLATSFDSRPDDMQALKLVAYANTAAWVAGIFSIIPVLGLLALIGGLYSIYLFYVGLPVMMKTPQAKVVPYMVVSVIVLICVYFVIGLVTAAISGVGATYPY